MIKIHKTKVPANIATMSLVGIHNEDYPLSYGNYFTMKVEKEYQIPNLNESMSEEGMDLGFMVCNFNCENFEEAMKRFLSDNEVEITIFQVDEEYPFIAITDERIPENWYRLWSEDMGYCNGGIHGENYQEVAKTLGKRFGGDENYVYVKPENEETLESKVVKCSFIPVIKNNASLVATVLGDLDLSKCEKIDVSETIKCSDKPSCLFYEGDKDE